VENLNPARVRTGIDALDAIVGGGLIAQRGYLIRGGPGTGKTTLGYHFLQAGIEAGERLLLITLGESATNLRQNAWSIGIDLSTVAFLDLSPSSDFFVSSSNYDLFTPAEAERDPITSRIVDYVQKVHPDRVFFDSTSHLRYLSIDTHQFRRQLLSFIRFLLEHRTTVMFTSEASISAPDDDIMYLSDGVITLSRQASDRYLEVCKMRGSHFHMGCHTLRLTAQGAVISPVLRLSDNRPVLPQNIFASGLPQLDSMLHGGIESGTVTFLTGPSGVGKSMLGLHFICQAAATGHRAVLYIFEESRAQVMRRAAQLNLPVQAMVESGQLRIVAIEPLLMTDNEVALMVRQEVEQRDVKMVMFDSVTGYRLAVRSGDVIHSLRILAHYLCSQGVTVLAINETETLLGQFSATDLGISFLADNIIFLRYLELHGELRKAIGVLKKRLSGFKHHLSAYHITAQGIEIGGPLRHLRGVLNGVPEMRTLSDDEPDYG
jgi:circadian clock protein KaiC